MEKDMMNDLNKGIDEAASSSTARDPLDQITDLVDEARTEAEILIRRHPIQSVLIAAGIGFLVGALLSGD